jgi:ELWxxDGT repeat protein
VGGTLFFVANDGFHDEPWRSDGTEAGTVMVKGTLAGFMFFSYGMTAVGDTLYFITQWD